MLTQCHICFLKPELNDFLPFFPNKCLVLAPSNKPANVKLLTLIIPAGVISSPLIKKPIVNKRITTKRAITAELTSVSPFLCL